MSDDDENYMTFFNASNNIGSAWLVNDTHPTANTICVCVFGVGYAEPSTSSDKRRKANNICVILYTNQITCSHQRHYSILMRCWSLSGYVHELIRIDLKVPREIIIVSFHRRDTILPTTNRHHIRKIIVYFTPSMRIIYLYMHAFFSTGFFNSIEHNEISNR